MKTIKFILKKASRILLGVMVLLTFIAMFNFTSDAAWANFNPKSAQKAIETAQKNHQYLFLMFYKEKDVAYNEMENETKRFIEKSSQKIMTYQALATNKKETDIIEKYKLKQVQLPILLVLAPNGALTGGFTRTVSEDRLTRCLVSDLTMNILKPIQEGKMALILLQNSKTKFNEESTVAANDFCEETGIKGNAVIIKADPDEPETRQYWRQFLAEPELSEAVIIQIVPPGDIGGIYRGKTTKEELLKGTTTALSSGGCCGG